MKRLLPDSGSLANPSCLISFKKSLCAMVRETGDWERKEAKEERVVEVITTLDLQSDFFFVPGALSPLQ